MAHAIWKGNLSFGLVNIPVSLVAAEKTDELHFHLLDRRDKSAIKYQRVNAQTGHEVPWDDIVRGYEFEPDRYVIFSDDDFKRANPVSTQTVEILEFVDLAQISTLYFDKPYYLAPDGKATKSYALLRETLSRSGKAGIAKVVIHTRQHLAAVIATEDLIVLNLMRFADELRDPADLDLPAAAARLTDKELKMARQLVDSMIETWDPSRYRDDYRTDVKALIDRRVAAGDLEAGKKLPAPRRPAAGKVVDLMALLQKSLQEGGKRPSATTRSGSGHAAANRSDDGPDDSPGAKAPTKAAAKPGAKSAAKPAATGTKTAVRRHPAASQSATRSRRRTA
jgi:DNA end-binding protein Ku